VDTELSTFGLTHPERDDGPAHMRVHRLVYATTSAALLALLVVVLLDVRGAVLGVDSTVVVEEAAGGVVFRVEYPEVTRPGLASPFAIEVTRAGGFEAPIEVAISRPWIEVWDENGMYPTPDNETGDENWVVYEFEPPDGDTFRFFFDTRLEPARQEDVSGTVELREEGVAVASVEMHTAVRP
jgi:hypothetical protein